MLSNKIQKSLLNNDQYSNKNYRYFVFVENEDLKVYSIDMILDNSTV
jgi:hypothetical protein